jgi:hypothetical protein
MCRYQTDVHARVFVEHDACWFLGGICVCADEVQAEGFGPKAPPQSSAGMPTPITGENKDTFSSEGKKEVSIKSYVAKRSCLKIVVRAISPEQK